MGEFVAFFFSWQGQQVGILFYLLIILINTVINTVGLRRLGSYPHPQTWPRLAVLIPARNEEATIARCLHSLLAQDYPAFSIWVLDDASTDRTPAILADLAASDALDAGRLHVIHGAPLPVGWLGKSWACQQLADAVPDDVDLLLFVDADTWHHPHMLRDAVAASEAEETDLLSAIPQQVAITLAEKLTVPILPWSLFTHFPLALAYRLGWQRPAAAIGQLLLFRRTAYGAIGGHGSVRGEIAEDMALARLVAQTGLRWRLLPGTERVWCRMYRSVGAAWEGFGKNLYAVFGHNLPRYLFIWLWLGIVFLGPWLMWIGGTLGGLPMSPRLAEGAIVLAFVIWGLTAWKLRLPVVVVLLYPAVIAAAFLLSFHSLGQTLGRRSTWKERRLP